MFARFPGRLVVSDAQAFPVPEGLLLHEACHRACALHVGRVAKFELRVLVHPIFGDWKVYEHGRLRR
jgi:hypothetical protein